LALDVRTRSRPMWVIGKGSIAHTLEPDKSRLAGVQLWLRSRRPYRAAVRPEARRDPRHRPPWERRRVRSPAHR